MVKLISIYWRDIPAQVVAREGRKKHKQELDARFMKAIDRAAMRAGRGSSDAYLADWRRESETVSGDMETLVADKVRVLEREFPEAFLEKMVKAGGLAEGIEPEG